MNIFEIDMEMQQILNNGLPGYSEVPVQGSNFCWENGVEQDPEEFDPYQVFAGQTMPEFLNCLCRYRPDDAWQLYQANCSYYLDVYWYTPDYLGNTEYITDLSGAPFQYFYYSPFGEAIVSQHAQTGNYNSPFRFNAKELDSETGLYYYGARYYSPRTSIWLSVDPLAMKYPNHTPYAMVGNNPILRIDIDGRQWDREEDEKKANDLNAKMEKRQSYWEKKADKYEARANKAFAKGKDEKGYDLKNKAILARAGADEMKKGQEELKEMGKSDTRFRFVSSDKSETYMDEDGVVVMEYESDATAVHEAKHGHQHITGEVTLEYGVVHNADLSDEVSGYSRQYSFSPSSVKGIMSDFGNINDITDIETTWVRGIYFYDKNNEKEHPYERHSFFRRP